MGKVEECSETLCREGVGRRCLLSWPVDGDTGPSIKRGRFGNTSLNGNRESLFIQGFYFQKTYPTDSLRHLHKKTQAPPHSLFAL